MSIEAWDEAWIKERKMSDRRVERARKVHEVLGWLFFVFFSILLGVILGVQI